MKPDTMLDPSLRRAVQPLVGPIEEVRPLGGGSINDVRLVRGRRGSVVLKLGREPRARAMFAAEAEGLTALRQAGALRVPEVLLLHDEPPALALEYIAPGRPDGRFWATFGESLALLHRTRGRAFGFPHDNFIGSLPQKNTLTADGAEFYRRYRLEAQLAMPGCQRLLDRGDRRAFERLFRRLPDLLPDEPPALIHGDLWSGNFLCDASGRAALIDPATCWCYREMDIAMAQLFGGFAPAFFEAYAAAWPHEPGLPDRIDLFQLY
ncbi:MAG: fructosamine kinase, partial [Gammaproteobacteria bacterium]